MSAGSTDWERKLRVFRSTAAASFGLPLPEAGLEATHPISPGRVRLELPAPPGEATLLSTPPGDAKRAFFHLYAVLPRLLGGGWLRYPADPRVPDRSVWHHAALASALAGCEGGPCLLAYSVDPVRSLASEGRSIEELRARAWMVSDLVWAGLRTVCEELGPDHVLYPAVGCQPLFLGWLAEQGLLAGLRPPTADELSIPALSNRFLALVPEAAAEALAERVAREIRAEWKRISSAEVPWRLTWAVTPWGAESYAQCFDRSQRGLAEARARAPRSPGVWLREIASGAPCPPAWTRPASGEGLAFLVMDADHSTSLTRGTAEGFARAKDIHHSRTTVALDPEARRSLDPAVHLALSEALASFGLASVPAVLGKHGGFLIYVGGDDAVAVLPAHQALAAARAIRDLFRTSFVVRRSDGRVEQCPPVYRAAAGESLLIHPGEAATMSAAVVFLPAGTPVDGLMEYARRVLDDEAKDRAGRDAVAVAVWPSTGSSVSWAGKWARLAELSGTTCSYWRVDR